MPWSSSRRWAQLRPSWPTSSSASRAPSKGRATSSSSERPTAAGDRLELVIRVGVPLTTSSQTAIGELYGEIRAELLLDTDTGHVINPQVSGESQDT
jgi:hypothetical protein